MSKGDFYEGTKHIKIPFSKHTSYQQDYLNWEAKGKPVTIANPYIMQTDNRYPFYSRVSNDCYGNYKFDEAERVSASMFGKQQFKNPIGVDIALNHKTTNS